MPVPDLPGKVKSETAKSRSFFVARARSGLARPHIRSAFCLATLTEDAPGQPVPVIRYALHAQPGKRRKSNVTRYKI